jgi:uncharacterized protein YutE (UPF0331/DUF86 family)
MVADPEIVRERCGRIRRYVRDLRDLSLIAADAFKQNRERQYAVLYALQLAIEACIEIGTHICAAEALGIPSSYAETFDFLEQGKVVDAALAGKLRAMARFRNRIVHFYWEVDLDEVYRILTCQLADFDEYLVAVERYLDLPARS